MNHLLLHKQCNRVIQQRVCCYSRSDSKLFSTKTNAPIDSSNRNRVPKTLYRQLLSWCRRYADIPFNPLPPLTLAPPQVNPVALKRLKEMRVFLDNNTGGLEEGSLVDDVLGRRNNHPAHYALYKKGLVIKDNLITFPEIKDATELRSVIRSVYWLNNEYTIENIENAEENTDDSRGTTDDEQKGQISLAFEAIKSCNQLSSSELDSRQAKREDTIEIRSKTEGAPLFHVGQVVKHKKAKWRGVVVGWATDTPKASGQLSKDRLTSLTTKQYDIAGADANETEETLPPNEATVKYTILVDMHDSSLLNASKSIALESQEDLFHIDEPCLHRIHNNLINQYFSKFDPNTNSYVPNKVVEYVYPLDRFSDAGNDDQASSFPPELQDACKGISNGIHEISHKLLPPLLELNKHQQADDNGTVSLASTLISMLQSMSLENQRGNTTSPLDLAISSVQKLNRFHSKVTALEWSHNTHTIHNKTIEYKLGQTVKHKLFNFRGVVTAWDPKPYMDVSRWDGLQDIDNPNDKPFYHIRPDVNDCIAEFGSPRSWRYVCQDNLEPYDLKHGRIELEMELDSEEWGWDKENGWFAPSEELKFMHAEAIDNEEHIIETIGRLKEIMSDCLLSIQGRGHAKGLFSFDELFYLLKSAERLEDAKNVEEMIREVFKEHPDSSLRKKLDSGITELIDGKTKKALETFSDIVAAEPSYGEAWNKKATCHYMLGETDAAIEASNKALETDPRNFQALAGIGLVQMDRVNDNESLLKAIDAFQQCLDLNPWSMISARLSVCIGRRTGLDSSTNKGE